MAITPVEIRHVRLGRAFSGGYRKGEVDSLLEDVVESYESVWRDRADFADKVEKLEQDLERYRELEALLRTTLVSAERAAPDLKDQARREAQLIVDEAHAEARSVVHEAADERERLAREARRIRSLLRSALDAMDEGLDPGHRAEAA